MLISLWIKSWRISLCPSLKALFAQNQSQQLNRVIFAIWHQDLPASIALNHAFRPIKAWATLISSSQDGNTLARLLKHFHFKISRGSSSKNQLAIRSLYKDLSHNHSVLIALDGPRGPAFVAKKGPFWLAEKTESPIYILQFSAKHSFRISSWDKMIWPFPFKRIQITLIEASKDTIFSSTSP
jgi:lysophospholipid acyltransferase (LPLAT)-like uncharacterized protein